MKTIRLSEVIGGGYNQFWNFRGRYLVVKGSRGSKKSKTTALKIMFNLTKYPLSNALVIRQTFNTLRDSCWKELKWAAERFHVDREWNFTVTPLEATNKLTGQKIYFRGLDDPMKVTSITVDHGYLCYCWFQEAYEIKSEEAFNKIDLSLRGQLPDGYFRQEIFSFNPWSEHCWLKKRFFDTPNTSNKLALTTTYKVNEWLGQEDLALFEQMKEQYPRRYEIEGLGHWGISEGLIYTNWKVEPFQRQTLDLPLCIGLDFGWQDPTAISVMRVDEENKKLYVCDEFYSQHKTIEQVADWLIHNGYSKSVIMADAAEPRSIVELQQKGLLKVRAAAKGKNSIMEGVRKLQEYQMIVHPSCKNFQIELSNYTFDKDKQTGEWIDKPIDQFNHLMDASRYGIQCLSQRKQLQTLDRGALF